MLWFFFFKKWWAVELASEENIVFHSGKLCECILEYTHKYHPDLHIPSVKMDYFFFFLTTVFFSTMNVSIRMCWLNLRLTKFKSETIIISILEKKMYSVLYVNLYCSEWMCFFCMCVCFCLRYWHNSESNPEIPRGYIY